MDFKLFRIEYSVLKSSLSPYSQRFSPFWGKDVVFEPVLHLFGRDCRGNTVCCNVFGVWPYVIIKHDHSITSHKLSAELNGCLINQPWKQAVYGAIGIKAKNIYGFHADATDYLKILLIYPDDIKAASEVLLGGKILKSSIQPCNAHLPYVQQFQIDYDVCGSAIIHVSDFESRTSQADSSTPNSNLAFSQCAFEIDTSVSNINVQHSQTSQADADAVIPSLADIWKEEKLRRQMLDLPMDSFAAPLSQVRNDDKSTREIDMLSKFDSLIFSHSPGCATQQSTTCNDTITTASASPDQMDNLEVTETMDECADDDGYNCDDQLQDMDQTMLDLTQRTIASVGVAMNGSQSSDKSNTLPTTSSRKRPAKANDDDDEVKVDDLEPQKMFEESTIKSQTKTQLPADDFPDIVTTAVLETFAASFQVNEHELRPLVALCPISICVIVFTVPQLPPAKSDGMSTKKYCLINGEQIGPLGAVELRKTLLASKEPFGDDELLICDNESHLLIELSELVRRYDPDILAGYETDTGSWNYTFRRDQILYKEDHPPPPIVLANTDDGNNDEIDGERFVMTPYRRALNRIDYFAQSQYATIGASTFQDKKTAVYGRVLLNVWRLVAHPDYLTLSNYSLSNVVKNVLSYSIPCYSLAHLTKFWKSGCYSENSKVSCGRATVLSYISRRATAVVQVLLGLDVVRRTTQMARIFGIEFNEVLTRGSQYRVESVMLRLCARKHFVCPTPSPAQRQTQATPECVALNMEPASGIYYDPVIVLDFQSLYPSVIIAFNYCYSTCLGRLDAVESLSKEPNALFQLGCLPYCPTDLKDKQLTRSDVNISPNGVIFVKEHVRKGILPLMLEELLSARQMIKRSMKLYKKDFPTVYKTLDARQLALKLLANVIYGYTSASFSGRMPCVDIADSIVRKGRECLENAIAMVNRRGGDRGDAWHGCRTIYGDTDSLFVVAPGRGLKQAFVVAEDIRDAITSANCTPVKMKLEKVYMGCVLQAKKRYCGWMHETVDSKPVFDAKGLETVRRDGCQFVAKTLKQVLLRLFKYRDVARAKACVTRAVERLQRDRVPLDELCFAREYRGRHRYAPSSLKSVPVVRLADERVRRGVEPECAEPLPHERVPYYFEAAPPNSTLIQCVADPFLIYRRFNEAAVNGDEAMMKMPRVNVEYYVMRQLLPVVHRVTMLLPGENALEWCSANVRHQHRLTMSLPKAPLDLDQDTELAMIGVTNAGGESKGQQTLSQHLVKAACSLCKRRFNTTSGLVGNGAQVCRHCHARPPWKAVLAIEAETAAVQRSVERCRKICSLCRGDSVLSANDVPTACVNRSCRILQMRIVDAARLGQLLAKAAVINTDY